MSQALAFFSSAAWGPVESRLYSGHTAQVAAMEQDGRQAFAVKPVYQTRWSWSELVGQDFASLLGS